MKLLQQGETPMKAIFALALICVVSTAEAGELDNFQSMDVLKDAEILSAEPIGEGYRLLARKGGVIFSCFVMPAEFKVLYEKLEFSCIDGR
jgi:hypothetical protein